MKHTKKIRLQQLAVVFIFIVNLSYSASGDSRHASGSDYLLLTKENIPQIQVVIRAAIDNAAITPTDLADAKKKMRRSSLLPRLRIGAALVEDSISQFGYVAGYDSQNRDITSGLPGTITRTQYSTRYGQTGEYDDRLNTYASVTWDLSNLVFGAREPEYASMVSRRASFERRRIVEVARRYALLAAQLPDNSEGRIKPKNIASVLEHAIYLDRITGGLISKTVLTD